ncbi:hypothetical protein [Terrabacter sp. 2YAF2]|uniref:hypothetical protein n=1 Tax=Terrabacter sp. 2YAF2 TaxID=3233026 RepID=UPI003F989E35
MADTSDGVLKMVGGAFRDVAMWSTLAGVPFSLWLVWRSVTSPEQPWLWVAYTGWAMGFLGMCIALAPRLKPVRTSAVVTLPALSVAGVALLGVFSSLGELAGPLLFGLGVVGAAILVLRLVDARAKDVETRERHDELIALLRSLEERLVRLEEPGPPPARPLRVIDRLLARLS